MVTAEELLQNEKYKFEHLKIDILKQTEGGEVDAFSASYRRDRTRNVLTEALKEANQLWDATSGKRPPGYLVFAAFEGNGGMASSIMISERLFKKASRSKLNRFRKAWVKKIKSIPLLK